MSSIDGITEVLSLGDVRYIVVRPHRGMKDGWEVINAWNEDQLREFGPEQKDAAVEFAQDKAAWGTFDSVLVVCEPKEKDNE